MNIYSKQRFRNEKDNAFTEKVNKILLTANDDKRIQAIDSIETFAYRTNKEIMHKKRRN